MAYSANVPESFTNPSADQPLIQANFQAISTAFNLNHGNFDDPDEGKHTFLQMPEQSSAPTTAANEAGLFSQENSLVGLTTTELAFRRESNGTVIEFTGLLGAEDGWTRLPSGILLKWGEEGANGSTPTNFPTDPTIPIFTSVFSAQVSVDDSGGTPNTFATFQSMTVTAITVYGSSRTSTGSTAVRYRYLVIGL